MFVQWTELKVWEKDDLSSLFQHFRGEQRWIYLSSFLKGVVCLCLHAVNSSWLRVCPPCCDARCASVSSDLLTASLGDVPVKILKDQRFCSVIISVIPRSLLASATSTHKKKICCVDVSPAASSFLCSCSPRAVFCWWCLFYVSDSCGFFLFFFKIMKLHSFTSYLLSMCILLNLTDGILVQGTLAELNM